MPEIPECQPQLLPHPAGTGPHSPEAPPNPDPPQVSAAPPRKPQRNPGKILPEAGSSKTPRCPHHARNILTTPWQRMPYPQPGPRWGQAASLLPSSPPTASHGYPDPDGYLPALSPGLCWQHPQHSQRAHPLPARIHPPAECFLSYRPAYLLPPLQNHSAYFLPSLQIRFPLALKQSGHPRYTSRTPSH